MNSDVRLDHPLALEILSLRDALVQQQHAAQQASAQVQKYAFEALSSNNRARQLTLENAALQSELDLLRGPRPTASPSTAEAELTLALRRVNSRLEHTENTLQKVNTSLLNAHAERDRTAGEVAAAYHLLEAARSQEVELRSILAARDIEKNAYELALTDYAALVRDLEKRTSESEGDMNGHASGSVHPALKVMAAEDTAQVKDLTAELARARADISTLQAQLDVERGTSETERLRLAEARVEVEKHVADDKSAAALVERYMKFSQYHTDVLQRALTDQSVRHEATRNSLALRVEHLEHSLASESARNHQLHAVVDTLVDDLSRESAGRRREVRVRLAITGREAKIEEALRRWERKIREHPKPQMPSDESAGLLFGLDDLDQVRSIIDTLGAPLVFRTAGDDYAAGDGSGDDSLAGPLARMLAADIAVEALTAELERETTRRMYLERERARSAFAVEKPQTEDSHTKPAPQLLSTMPSSASVSLVSHDTTSSVSLPESVTTASFDEGSQVAPTPTLETAKAATALPPPPPLTHELSLVALETPPLPPPPPPPPPSSTSAIPFPSNSPLLPEPQELTESSSFDDDPAVQDLLAQLPTALQRYVHFQSAFRDCHLTLSALKSELRQRPRTYLLAAVERLDDYNEDARVEIEIRIADEARMANGLEAMLHLSGSQQTDVVAQLRAFVEGSAPEVQKAIATATRKRDDLEHDIAAVKLTVHAPESEPGDGLIHVPTPEPEPVSPGPQSWGWKRPFRQSIPTRPGSPVQPLSLAFPSPHQALRRVASGTMGHSRGSSLGGAEAKEPASPMAAMGLRIPMPTQPSFAGSTGPLPSPMTPNHRVPPTLTLERTRTTSMYHIGLGRSRSGLDLSKRHASLTPASMLAGEDSDDSVE